MNKDFANFFINFFSVTALSGYVGGVVTALVVVWIVDKQHNSDRIHRMRLMAILWVFFAIFIGYISVKSEKDTICIAEVQGTLYIRADLSDRADRLSDERDSAATEWLVALQNPPPEIRSLKWEDETRQVWLHSLAHTYQKHIQEIQRERQDALKERASHKLPESRCGKS